MDKCEGIVLYCRDYEFLKNLRKRIKETKERYGMDRIEGGWRLFGNY